MTTLEEIFEQFKQLPDWNKYPMPEVFYQHFKVPKPKPSNAIMDALVYSPPLSMSLNKNGKVEVRESAPGGVRTLELQQPPPVEVKKLNEETNELEDYPPPKQLPYSQFFELDQKMPFTTKELPLFEIDDWIQKFKAQIADGNSVNYPEKT
jgi:hypothetical protein